MTREFPLGKDAQKGSFPGGSQARLEAWLKALQKVIQARTACAVANDDKFASDRRRRAWSRTLKY
jgi:hypothetical protein